MMGLAFSPALAEGIYINLTGEQSVVLSNHAQTDDDLLLIAAASEPSGMGDALMASAAPPQPMPHSLLARASVFAPLVEEVARTTRLDAKLLHAVIATESAYNPTARSPKGALGMMQLMPATARRYGVADSHEPLANILGGARYLSDLLTMFDQDIPLALAAYNAGEQAVIRHGRRIPPFRETMSYVPRVLEHYRTFKRLSL